MPITDNRIIQNQESVDREFQPKPNLSGPINVPNISDVGEPTNKDISGSAYALSPNFTKDDTFGGAPEHFMQRPIQNKRYNNTLLGENNEELKHNAQSGWDRAGNALTNVAIKIGAFTAQNVGFIGGAPGALGGDISNMTDNWLVKIGDRLHEDVQNNFPIYKGDKYTNGSIFQKLSTPDWWLDDGMDRFALGISTILPMIGEAKGLGLFGAAVDETTGTIKATGLLSKGIKSLEEVPSLYNKLGKTFGNKLFEKAASQSAETITSLAKTAIKGPANFDNIVAGMQKVELMSWGAIGQSGLNARESQVEIKKRLIEQRDQGLNNLENDAIETIAADGAKKAFMYSLPTSLFESLVEIPQIFSTMKSTKSVLEKIINPETWEATFKSVKPTIPKLLGKAFLTGVEHGPINESLQVAIGRYLEDSIAGKIDKSGNPITDDKGNVVKDGSDPLFGIFKDWVDNVNDPNGQNNIALGFIQGVLTTLLGHGKSLMYGEYAKQDANNKRYVDTVNNAILQRKFFSSPENFYEKENGKVLFEEDGKTPKLDQTKLGNLGASLVGALITQQAKLEAIKKNDTAALDKLNYDSLSQLAQTFMGDTKGMEYFSNLLRYEAKNQSENIERVNDSKNGIEITPQLQLEKNLEHISNLKRAYDNIEKNHNSIDILNIDSADKKKLKAGIDYVNNVKQTQYTNASDQIYYTSKINENAVEILSLGTGETIKDPSSPSEQRHNDLVNENTYFHKKLETIKYAYKNLVDKNNFKQGFEYNEIPEEKPLQENDTKNSTSPNIVFGKEYSLKSPILKEGTKIQLAPKITILSQSLGGEYEVQLPNGKKTYLTPEEFKKYNISDENNTSQEMADVMGSAIDTVLKSDKYIDIKKNIINTEKELGEGKKLDKLKYINSLDNQSLIDDVEKEFNKQTKEIIKTKEKQKKEAEKLKKNKEEITKQQIEITLNSGSIGTNNPANDIEIPESKIPNANILFISGTSESEKEGYYVDDNGNVLDPIEEKIHLQNQRQFLNNVGGMKNRNSMRAILVTPVLAKAYGLDGLVEMSYGKPLSEIPDVENVDDGFVAQVFVEQVSDKLFFVDKEGKQLGEVGKQLDKEVLQNVIFQTMRTTKLTYNDGTPRYRKDQKEEAEAYSIAWKQERAKIFNIDPNVSPTIYEFQVSRGIAKKGEEKNHVSGTLIDEKNEEEVLATDQTLIQISTTGIIAHKTGQINIPKGRPVIVYHDNVEFLNNGQFTQKQAETIYEVINQIAAEITEQSNNNKRIIINKKLSRFLQNVLYWKEGKTTEGSNQINIAEDGTSISFAGKSYALPEIISKKSELMEDIKKAFHNINNKTLAAEMFSKPFIEYYMKDGELVSNEWTNYQTYLLSSKYPNGSARSVNDTPLSTKIIKPIPGVTNTHEQKYSTLQGLELPIGVIAKPKAAPVTTPTAKPATQRKYDYDGDTDNIFSLPNNFGDVIFTVKEGEEPKIDETSDIIIAARDKIISKIQSKEGNESLTKESLIPQAINFIKAFIKKELETDVAPVATVVTPVAPVAPVQAAPISTDAKEDIEKRREEVKNIFNENKLLAIHIIQNEKKIGSFDEYGRPNGEIQDIVAVLKVPVSEAQELLKQYLDSGKPEGWKLGDKYDFSKYDAELAALEGKPTEAPKEPGSFDPSKIGKRGDMGFRKEGVADSTDRMSEADLKAFKEWHTKNVPFIPFEVLERIININSKEKAWGVFEKGVSKFVKGGLRGTEYHEIGEAIWNGMLNKEEQKALIDEFRKKAGQFTDRETNKKYNHDDVTVSDNMVKEKILDDFADYRLGKLPARNLGERVRRFFKAIMDFFKSFVTKPSLKEQLFKAIDTGKFKDRELSPESKTMPPQYRAAGHLTEEQTIAYVNDMYGMAGAIILGNGKLGTIDKSALYNLKPLTIDDVFNKIEEFYTQQGVRQEFGDVTWKDLVVKTKLQLKSLLKIDFNDEENVSINEENANKNNYVREPFSTDYKKSAPVGIKFVSATILEREPTNQETSTEFKLPNPKINKKYQTYSIIPYGRVFSTMLDKLKNSSSIKKVIDKIVKLANVDANYVSMFQRLGGNMTNKTIDFSKFEFDDWRLFVEAMQTYTKQKPNAVVQFLSQGQVFSRSALVTEETKQLSRSWVQNLRSLSVEPDSIIEYDSVDKTFSVTEEIKNIPTGTPEEKIEFLNKIGIIFPIEAWKKLKGPQQKEFTDAVASIKTYLDGAKEIFSIQKKTLNVAGQYNTLAELVVNVTNPVQSNTRINLNGKQTNSFSDNNTPSVFENEFNEAETLEELLTIRPELNDVYSKGSLLLKKGGQFFDKNGKRTSLKLKVGYIEGTKNDDENKGVTSVSLTKGDRFTQELNQNINGEYYIMIPADGSTEWMMNMGNHVAFEDVEQGKDGWKQINSIFRGYLTDDVALALDADTREQLRNVGKKGKDLRIFKDILFEKNLSAIDKMIEEGSTQDDIEKYIDDNIDDINDSIKEYINDVVGKTKQILIDNEQITFGNRDEKTGQDYYKYKNLDDNFSKREKLDKNKLTEDDVTNIITFANANYIINNIEYHKIIFGDPYQFVIKENGTIDATKRYKSFFSPRRTTVDSPEFNTFLNREMNKVEDVTLKPGEPGYHEYKAWMDTVTVDDVTIAGSIANIQSLPENVRKAFAKTNEGDASSIMMDGVYRELKIKNGQWNIKGIEEKWHQWQMAWTRQNMPGFKYSDDARGKALAKHDEALVKTKEPKHIIEIVKPIVSGVTNGTNNIKLVLDKDSQMPLYYSMVKGTNLENLYLKMMKENKGYIIMISGRKVGAEQLHSLYTPKGEFNEEAFNNNIEVPWKAYGIQVENSYVEKQQSRGSQITKLVTLDLYSNGEVIGKDDERKEVIGNEVKRNNSLLGMLHKNGYDRFLKRLGVKDLGQSYKIVDKRALAKTLQDEMFRRELSDNIIDSIQLDENGEFIIPFEASPAYLQIKSILYSLIDKEITSPKVNGGAYVQAPVTLWEDSKKGRKIAIKTEDGYKQITRQEFDNLSPEEQKKVVLTDDTLKFYEDADGKRYCELMLPHWFKGKLGKHANKSDKELIDFLNNSAEGKELLSGIGFRIPTQSLSSIEVFKVKGFLPQYMGKTVIVPSEITTKAGSDFDIDKLNMYLKSIYIDKNGEIRIIKLKGTEQETKDFYANVFDEKLDNKIIKKGEILDAMWILNNGANDPENLVNRYSHIIDAILSEYGDISTTEEAEDALEKELNKLQDKNLQAALKEKFVENSYRSAIENEYYDSLEKLVSLPENFQRLVSPVSDDGLKEVSDKLDKLRGYDETKIKNRLFDRNYMTSLRHAFVTAKKWVGIAAVNITGHSLTQKIQAYIDPARFANISKDDNDILGNGEVLLDHNKLKKDGKEYISLSGILDTDGNYISDGLSGFATTFVDVAKDPYILKIIKSELVVGTFMFLRRVGVPKTQLAMFMNQPIIDEYLTMLDNKGSKNLFNSKNITAIKNKFPTTITQKDLTGFNKNELEDNIENYYATKDLGDIKNHEQQNILLEFLKYAKMAEYSFAFGQAHNYDTTKFQSGDSFSKKEWRTQAAQKQNIISSVNNLLENTFIGTQAEFLDRAMDDMGEVLVLETPQFTDITNEVLKSFEKDRFLSADKFDKIANKIKAAFLDYIIQKRSDVADNIKQQLIDDKTSVAQMLLKAKQKYPNVQIIQDLEVDSSGRIGGAQTVKLRVNDKLAVTENMYTGMMRELRDNADTNELYKGIVKLAIIQGTYQSVISIKNIIPIEDYSKSITPILAGLQVDEEIRAFAKNCEFQRNEWQDSDVVPIIEPKLVQNPQSETDYDLPKTFQGLFKIIGIGKNRRKIPGFFPTIPELEVNSQKRHLMFINNKYQVKLSNYDVIKMPRTIPIDKNDVTKGYIDVATGHEITSQTYAEMYKRGDMSLRNFYGYQKVKYADGSPLIARYDDEGNAVYVYKFINLHGDGNFATEYYGDGRPSIFNNGSQKNVKNIEGTIVSNELSDQDIVNYYGGELVPKEEANPITSTIEKETEVITPTQPNTEVKKKKLFTIEKGTAQKSFRGKVIEFVDNIDSKKETVVAMSNRNSKIFINQKIMEQKFEDKAWTTLVKQLDGSFATPLAENEFGSFNEWLTFALIHETKHDTIKKNEGETTGQYEDRINQAALADLRENYNILTAEQFDPNNEDLEGADEPNPCGI
jgi:hypothetical protein